jgi:hypothetical protein
MLVVDGSDHSWRMGMDTLDTILMFALTILGASSIGYGILQLWKGERPVRRGVGEIIVGVGFCLMGWDLLSGVSLVTGLGAVVCIGGGLLVPAKSRPPTADHG